MENKSHALAAGLFVLLLAALLAAMAAWLTRDTTGQRVFEIASREAVTGLQPQAGVRYKGVLVGRVASIALDPEVRGQVLVRVALQPDAPITTSTVASLGFQGVTGLAYVQLDDPAADTSAPLAATDGKTPRIPMRPGLVSRLTDQGAHLLGQLDAASQRLNRLISEDNQQQLMAAIERMGAAAQRIEVLAQHADQSLQGQAGPTGLNLPQLAAQAQGALQSMQSTSERLAGSAEVVRNSATEFRRATVRMTEPGGTLDRIARSTDALTEASQAWQLQFVPRAARASDDTARAVRRFGSLAEGINDQPQSLLLGRPAPAPGPGEPGFVAPALADR